APTRIHRRSLHDALPISCAWFPSVAAYCREHPEADMGVHLTLTCEGDVYRWGPISTADPASGLIDSEGYFYRTTADAQEHADAEDRKSTRPNSSHVKTSY